MFIADDGKIYDDEYFWEFRDLETPEEALSLCPDFPGIQKYREILGVQPPDPGQVLDGFLLNHDESRAILSQVFGREKQ